MPAGSTRGGDGAGDRTWRSRLAARLRPGQSGKAASCDRGGLPRREWRRRGRWLRPSRRSTMATRRSRRSTLATSWRSRLAAHSSPARWRSRLAARLRPGQRGKAARALDRPPAIGGLDAIGLALDRATVGARSVYFPRDRRSGRGRRLPAIVMLAWNFMSACVFRGTGEHAFGDALLPQCDDFASQRPQRPGNCWGRK